MARRSTPEGRSGIAPGATTASAMIVHGVLVPPSLASTAKFDSAELTIWYSASDEGVCAEVAWIVVNPEPGVAVGELNSPTIPMIISLVPVVLMETLGSGRMVPPLVLAGTAVLVSNGLDVSAPEIPNAMTVK